MKRKISIKGSSFFSKKKLPGGNSRTEYRPGKGKGFRIMSSDDTLPQNNINYNPYESLNSDYGNTFIDYEGAVESIKETKPENLQSSIYITQRKSMTKSLIGKLPLIS